MLAGFVSRIDVVTRRVPGTQCEYILRVIDGFACPSCAETYARSAPPASICDAQAWSGIVANPGAILREIPIAEILIYNPLPQFFLPGMGTVQRGTFGVLELPSLRFTVYRTADGTEVDIMRRTLF